MKKILSFALTLALAAAMVPAAFAAGKLTANPTNDKLTVNGLVRTPTVYKIGGSNFFQIRDVAAVLNGTGSQFSVGYSGGKVTVTTGQPYETTGKELKGAPSESKEAFPSNDAIVIDGETTSLTVYKIGGSNYFKLRDLGDALGFTVDWTAGKGVSITTASYTDDCDHEWITVHKDAVGHYENSGTHKVTYYKCRCGFEINSDVPNAKAIWEEHNNIITGCARGYTYWVEDVPNNSEYVIDEPAHDVTYCNHCGMIKPE